MSDYEGRPSVCGASFKFSKDGNTMGTCGDCEHLTIELEYQDFDPGKGGDCFAVIRTEGWSVDTAYGDGLDRIVEACRRAAQRVSEEILEVPDVKQPVEADRLVET